MYKQMEPLSGVRCAICTPHIRFFFLNPNNTENAFSIMSYAAHALNEHDSTCIGRPDNEHIQYNDFSYACVSDV